MVAFWGLYWGPPILGNYHLEALCFGALSQCQARARTSQRRILLIQTQPLSDPCPFHFDFPFEFAAGFRTLNPKTLNLKTLNPLNPKP